MIRTEGLDEAVALLQEIGRMNWTKEVLERYGKELVAKTKPYPSKPAGSRYVRTMNLSRQWYASADAKQLLVANRAPYSGYVQQRDTQAWMHRQHGWPTIEDRFESQYMNLVFERLVKEVTTRMIRKYA